jgi:hypothetical protein
MKMEKWNLLKLFQKWEDKEECWRGEFNYDMLQEIL